MDALAAAARLSGRVLVIDNYDSFTYNIVQYLGELGWEPEVHRNDAISVAAVLGARADAIVLSPGPGRPEDAGICLDLIRAAAGRVPLLGVCLGHQAVAAAYGGAIVRAARLMHGKTGVVAHRGDDLFDGLPNPLTVMRYHSLVVADAGFPAELEVTAWSADRPAGTEIMALRHRALPLYGVQFHPESIATEAGHRLVANFLLRSLSVAA